MEKNDILLFMVLFAFTAVFFILENFGNSGIWAMTIAFTIIGIVSMVVLQQLKSDEKYYLNLTKVNLFLTIAVAMTMVAVAALFSSYLGGALLSMNVLTPMTVSPSAVTGFLNSSLFQFSMVATSEELLKLAGYSELQTRGITIGGHKIKGMYAAIIIPVGLWACYHAIQAYNNAWMIIPAFINGLILIGLLEFTKSFLAPILAHGIYNTVTIIATSTTAGLPLFPMQWSWTDGLLVVLVILWFVLVIVPVVTRKKP